ncbi:unnamed protein product [Trifolium pratense]|uniref:Uncharacterized protein n=1 Tax=Trifolium pratense TaxID=57577 RepID=A0ACB0LF80_TRIPR|nr:unnamed protein product [Trifolium pratense]
MSSKLALLIQGLFIVVVFISSLGEARKLLEVTTKSTNVDGASIDCFIPGIPCIPGIPFPNIPGIPSIPGLPIPVIPGIPIPTIPGVPTIPGWPWTPSPPSTPKTLNPTYESPSSTTISPSSTLE